MTEKGKKASDGDCFVTIPNHLKVYAMPVVVE